MDAIEIKELSYSYQKGEPVIDSLSVVIQEGQKVALLGCNGAGKSTLMSLLLGVEWPDAGEITVCDLTVSKKNLKEIRRSVGMVFQNPDDQLFMPTVLDDIAFGPKNYGMDKKEVEAKTKRILEQMGIAHLSHKPPYRLSGGEKRSAALATALVMDPKLLLLDEPTAFLDPKSRRMLSALLNDLKISMLITTHDLEFVKNTCDRVLVLSHGKIAADGGVEEILSNQALLYDAGL